MKYAVLETNHWPGKGKTRWEVSRREPRALIMPDHGAFEV